MPDIYPNLNALLLVESHHVAIRCEIGQRSRVAIVAPHAGSIEPFTGELAEAIAGRDHRLYCFSGTARANNSQLHITSTRFSEPDLARVLLGAVTVVTIHGCRRPREPLTLLGGANQRLRDGVERWLAHAGFAVSRAPAPISGRHPRNVTNRALHGGVQLEISRAQRKVLKASRSVAAKHERDCSCQFCRYISAIRAAIDHEIHTRTVSTPALQPE